MNALQNVKNHLNPGQVYRRCDLVKWSNAVDRHLALLQKENTLLKLSGGLYYYPKKTTFGKVPADEAMLIKSFLKDSRFLLMTPSMYNVLGVGTTQLYNETIVYNHKRHGMFKIGNRTFRFVMKHFFPLELSLEFLLVDLVNNADKLVEDNEQVLERVRVKVKSMDRKALKIAVEAYGSVRTKKFLKSA